jgi:glycosyltransferase involved in cell wall biosynthesis
MTVVVLPAYNARATLERTVTGIPPELRTHLVLVDDASTDGTFELAVQMGIACVRHDRNRGYGANQKTCYRAALEQGADIVVMLHPDGQYEPRMVNALIAPIELGICDVVLGNRIRSRRDALTGGMPRTKYFLNRALTGLENVALGQNLGEFHSGMRAYTAAVLRRVPFTRFSDDFSFDSEMLVSCVEAGLRIGDVPVPTIYTDDSSQIGFRDGATYAVKTLNAVAKYLLARSGVWTSPIFADPGAFSPPRPDPGTGRS